MTRKTPSTDINNRVGKHTEQHPRAAKPYRPPTLVRAAVLQAATAEDNSSAVVSDGQQQ